MTRKTITKLDNSMCSKAEEVAYLRECADVPEGTYLASLFSSELLQWFERQVGSDLCCNIHGEMVKSTDARQLEELNEKFSRIIDEKSLKIIELEEEIKQVTHAHMKEAQARERAQDSFLRWKKNAEGMSELYQKTAVELTDANERNEALKQEVLELKATLWDMKETIEMQGERIADKDVRMNEYAQEVMELRVKVAEFEKGE